MFAGPTPWQTSFLVPNAAFVIELAVALGLFVIWPLVQALRSRRYLWAVMIVLLVPVGGAAWWLWWLVSAVYLRLSRPARRDSAVDAAHR